MGCIILQANLGNFDSPVDPVKQNIDVDFYRFTDENFPPITGLTPRLQYRMPKYFGWEMKPGYDIYIWLDGGWSFTEPDCVEWYINQLGDNDMAFFAHPTRKTIKQEVDHIEEYLNKGNEYITTRYKNGLHKEQYEVIDVDKDYIDDTLYASTAFIYRNNLETRALLVDWWYFQSRYFTCDQVVLPWLLRSRYLKVKTLDAHIYKNKYLTEVSKHK